MSDRDFERSERGEAIVLRLTREAKRNAITVAILDGLEQCCDDLDAGRARALVVTGEGGKAFCAGTDLAESASLGAEASDSKTQRARDLFVRIHRSEWLSIAALNGLAYGGGLELALACTFRVAAPGVKLSLPEVKLAVLPSYGGTQLLPALVGRARALDLMMTGRAVGAEEAIGFGLVDRIAAEPAGTLDAAFELLDAILVHSQFALDRVRRAVDASGPVVTDEGLAAEARYVTETMGSEDAREGVVAFLQKRKPAFVHR